MNTISSSIFQPEVCLSSAIQNRKATGAHYTPIALAQFVARQCISAIDLHDGRLLHVLDPAVGDGELLRAIYTAMPQAVQANASLVGYDTDERAVEEAKRRISATAGPGALELRKRDFLDVLQPWSSTPNLFDSASTEQFDVVIANPPYVRTQVLGTERSQALAAKFGLAGRVDLSFAFLIGISQVLVPGGVAGVITSNRFMTTKAGAPVRKRIEAEFDILHVWDLGDTRLFAAAVLPAVLVLRKKSKAAVAPPRFSSIYTATASDDGAREYPDVLSALHAEGTVSVAGQNYVVRHGELKVEPESADVWRLSTASTERWIKVLREHTALTFRDIGKIRVGVKTTADKVFIRSDWAQWPMNDQPELLRPLTTHHIGRRFRPLSTSQHILYTHNKVDGRRVPVRLEDHPAAARYLNQHRELLAARKYVADAGREWFEVWVPQDPELWSRPKLVFRDIAEKPMFWIDLDATVVNGDCYWLTAECDNVDLLWLAAGVGNSTFAEAFYDRTFNNKLYAGRRRFMSQYVEQFPLPSPESRVAKEMIALAKRIYACDGSAPATELERELDGLVWESFGLPVEKV